MSSETPGLIEDPVARHRDLRRWKPDVLASLPRSRGSQSDVDDRCYVRILYADITICLEATHVDV